MNSDLPASGLQLRYRGETRSQYATVFHAIAILVIIFGIAKAFVLIAVFLPYLSGQRSLPASYPSGPVEFVLNLIPFTTDIFAILAGIFVLLSDRGIRVLVVWAWCALASDVFITVFNGIWELRYQGSTPNNTGAQIISLIYLLVGAVTLPIVVIVIRGTAKRETRQRFTAGI